MSCASKSGMNSLYNHHKSDVDLAMAVPNWRAMIALPQDVKKDIKGMVKGMRKLQVLYNGKLHAGIQSDFSELSKSPIYSQYVKITSDEVHVNILVKETDDKIKELIIYAQSEDMIIIVGAVGGIKKKAFFEGVERLQKVSN